MVKVTTHMHAHIYPNLDKITSALDASEHADHSAPLREVRPPPAACCPRPPFSVRFSRVCAWSLVSLQCVEGMGEPEADFA